ncbi:MAG: DUF6077 domain-containing protein [Terriglobales bacterium]
MAGVALAVVLPFFVYGNPSGHDFEFHMHSWMEVLGQWHQGIVYPRWAALAQYGFGEARFVFYPPASWILGAALGAVLPWKAVPGAYVWIALTLSGCSMFVLARRWLERRDAIFAAALYAANPYYILVVYWRSAFAELLAGAVLPLLLLLILRLGDEEWDAAIPLGLVVAGAWLTNAPAAVMVNYSLVLLGSVAAVARRSPRVLWYTALAALLGAALAAFYIVPASYEQKWVSIGELLAPGVRPQDNFLFTATGDPDHTSFNLLVSFAAVSELAVLAVAGVRGRRRLPDQSALWWTLVCWSLPVALLMFSPSVSAWEHLPWLRFLQLPWRWLLCLNASLAVVVTLAWRRWFGRAAVYLFMLSVLLFVSRHTQPPWWDDAAEIAKLLAQHRPGVGYEGTDEYVPAGADPYNVSQDAPLVAAEAGAARVQVNAWAPESKSFTVAVEQPGNLVLRLFNYPAWQVTVNGQEVGTESQENTGQMMIPVQAGENRVQITLGRTWDRTLGAAVSSMTALGIAGLLVFRRKQLRLA